MTRFILTGLFVVSVVFFLATDTFAQNSVFPTQIVPSTCGGTGQPECNICDFELLLVTIMRFTVAFSVIAATGLFAWAGALMVTAQDNSGQRDRAKGIFWNVVIGLVVVLGAYVFVDTIMKTFLRNADGTISSEFGPWNDVICPAGFNPSVQTVDPPVPVTNPNNPNQEYFPPTAECPTCTTANGITCKEGANCAFAPQIADRVAQMAADYPGMMVTEGFPPTADHCSKCHYTGTCFDARSATKDFSIPELQKMKAAAEKNNFMVTFESRDCEYVNTVKNAGITAICINVEPHFSVYDRLLGNGGRSGNPGCGSR